MNLTGKILYKIGSMSMMMTGAGHLALHFAHKGGSPASDHMTKQMDVVTISIGFGSRTFLEFFQGFSITMGILLIFTGLQNFLLARNLRLAFDNNKAAVSLPILLAGITFIISLKYFMIPPQVLSLIAFIAYSWSLWKLSRKQAS
jgi:hypothetical protein